MNRIIRSVAAVVAACVLAGPAWADPHWRHPRTSVELGFYWGWPGWHPFYPYPVYAPPPVIVVPPAAPPPIYIEQPRVAPTFEPGYWYYCREAGAYYPTVKECPGPWEKVAPQPAK